MPLARAQEQGEQPKRDDLQRNHQAAVRPRQQLYLDMASPFIVSSWRTLRAM
jgi:hypothetical protein